MTIVSTAAQIESRIDPIDGSFVPEDAPELKSFPPITDTIVWVKQVDWADVRQRCRGGLNNVGLVLAVVGEKTHDFGCWLANV
tara:strand:+ start:1215 stop:1463 length:249 start_codon:yes stop_codon:yes gene_type:complete